MCEESKIGKNYEKRFYTLSDKNGRPLVTVCIMSTPKSKWFARGVAICSPTENPRKTKGRDKAYGRAIEAIHNRCSDMVVRRPEALYQLGKVGAFKGDLKKLTNCKSTFFDREKHLTSIEKKMLGLAEAA